MPKKITITLKEDVGFLNASYSRTTSRLQQDRVKTLLYLSTKKYHYQSDIAKKLGRTKKTVRDWLKLYATSGFDALIKVKSGGNNTRTLSDKVIELIAEKVTDSTTTINSYIELQLLLEKQTGENIVYGALCSHCRRKFRTKLKVTRKFHY